MRERSLTVLAETYLWVREGWLKKKSCHNKKMVENDVENRKEWKKVKRKNKDKNKEIAKKFGIFADGQR